MVNGSSASIFDSEMALGGLKVGFCVEWTTDFGSNWGCGGSVVFTQLDACILHAAPPHQSLLLPPHASLPPPSPLPPAACAPFLKSLPPPHPLKQPPKSNCTTSCTVSPPPKSLCIAALSRPRRVTVSPDAARSHSVISAWPHRMEQRPSMSQAQQLHRPTRSLDPTALPALCDGVAWSRLMSAMQRAAAPASCTATLTCPPPPSNPLHPPVAAAAPTTRRARIALHALS